MQTEQLFTHKVSIFSSYEIHLTLFSMPQGIYSYERQKKINNNNNSINLYTIQ